MPAWSLQTGWRRHRIASSETDSGRAPCPGRTGLYTNFLDTTPGSNIQELLLRDARRELPLSVHEEVRLPQQLLHADRAIGKPRHRACGGRSRRYLCHAFHWAIVLSTNPICRNLGSWDDGILHAGRASSVQALTPTKSTQSAVTMPFLLCADACTVAQKISAADRRSWQYRSAILSAFRASNIHITFG